MSPSDWSSDVCSSDLFIAEDGYKVEYTLEEVARSDYLDEQDPEKKLKLILAWEQDGKAFDPQAGNPLQLVVGQREPGDVNKPFWVRNVETIVID
jgi:DMSO/TMAO reductase YedYZ molybdopterin-dependent catalytic subunit